MQNWSGRHSKKVQSEHSRSCERDRHRGRVFLGALQEAELAQNDAETFIFYFSGHGWNIGAQQFVAAADLRLDDRGTTAEVHANNLKTRDLYYTPQPSLVSPFSARPVNMISMEEIQSSLALVKSPYKVIIIDSCSTNPFSRVAKQGPTR